MNSFLDSCRAVIGDQYVLTEAEDTKPYTTDWRRRGKAKALAVLRPKDTEQVAALVRLCNEHSVPVVPQGGNSGLVLGSVPDDSGTAVILSLKRMNQVRAVDAANNTITVEAGCILQDLQNAADAAERLFPLSLASEGTCTIGGNLSSNAGGTAVLRYGNTRELCLGLEVVTASGEIWHGLRGLRKDNTGYDLRDLFIGAEGTLGIITAAVMKLFPRLAAQLTAFVAVESAENAVQLLALAQQHCGAALTGFELMSDFCMHLVRKHFPDLPMPFAAKHPYYVLVEISDSQSEAHAYELMQRCLEKALEQKLANDVVIANSITQSLTLWKLREQISAAQAAEGKNNIKHDVSLPISKIPEFIPLAEARLQEQFPSCRVVCFGHVGDGNLHYNVSPPVGADEDAFLARQAEVNEIVHDTVHEFNGSISAEHGLGALKREEILRYKSPLEMQMMRAIKAALDPKNLMNPGKIL
jgi:FAD/FMN-containing dehydrogenase